MTEAMKIYLCANQLLLGKKPKVLPSVALDYLKDSGLLDLYSKACDVKQTPLHSLDKLFINLCKTPDYAFAAVDETKAPLTISSVANAVRENDYETDSCYHWCSYLISDIKESFVKQDYIADSVLFLTGKTRSEEPDLDKHLRNAFSMYTWGALYPDAGKKKALKAFLKLYTIDGDTSIKRVDFEGLLKLLIKNSLSARDIGECVLTVSDLSTTLPSTQCLCFWSDDTRSIVNVLLPRGTSETTVVLGALPISEFCGIIMSDKNAFTTAVAKGQRIHFQNSVSC